MTADEFVAKVEAILTAHRSGLTTSFEVYTQTLVLVDSTAYDIDEEEDAEDAVEEPEPGSIDTMTGLRYPSFPKETVQ